MLKILLIFSLSFFALFSCEKKQELRQKEESRQQAISGCKNSKFVGEVLSKDNVLNLFRCLGWHLELSNLYNELEKINTADWNLFSAPFNEVFFKEANHELRSELFSFFYKLEADGSLDQLSIFLSKVDFKGVSDFVEVLFRCQQKGSCSEKDLRVVKALVPDEDTYEKVMLFLDYFKKSIIKNDPKLILKNLSHFLDDQKIENFAFELMKNDDSLIFNDVASKIVLPSIRDFIFEEKSGQSRLLDFSQQFKSKENFSEYLNNQLISNVFEITPTFRVVSKHYGMLPCQLGSSESLSSFDLDYRFVNFIERTIGPTASLGKNLIEETAFTLLANQLCKNLPAFSDNLKRYNFYSSSPYYEMIETNLGLEKFNKSLIKLLSNSKNHQLLSMLYELSMQRVSEKNKLKDLFYLVNLDDLGLVYDFSEYVYTNHLGFITTFENILYTSELDLFYLTSYFLTKFEGNLELNFLFRDLARRLEKNHLSFSRNLLKESFSSMQEPRSSIENLISLLKLSEDLPLVLESEWFEAPHTLNSLVRFLTSTSKMLENKSVQKDVSRLVSSRYLIRAIKLLSLGGTSGTATFEEIVKGIKKISYVKNSKNFQSYLRTVSDKELACIESLTNDNFTLSKILKGLPEACKVLDAPGELVLILAEVNRFNFDFEQEEYQVFGERPELFNESLFGNKSLAGDGVLLLDTFFNIFYKSNETSDRSELVQEFVSDLFDFLSKDEFLILLDSGISLFKSYFDADPIKQMYHRNYFISDYLDELSLSGEKVTSYFKELGVYFKDFNNSFVGVSSKEVTDYKSCDEYFIFWIGYDQCPDTKSISNSIHNVSRLLLRKNGANRPTALEMLMKLALPSEGVEIPYEAENKRKVNFSVKEILNMAVNVNDPEFIDNGKRVNSQIVDFWVLNERGKKEKKRYLMSTSQRMETTVREVQFDLNYLGVSYMNTVARGEDYAETVKSNFKLLKRCALYFRYCLRFFSKEEHLMVRNGIATYPALWDLEDYWGHGDAMQGLITSLVASSSKKAAKADLINFRGFRIPTVPSDRELKKHNGSIFTQLSMISVFTNFGRVLESRLGSFSNVRSFLKSQEFSAFSEHFLKNITYKATIDMLDKILNKALKYKDQNNLTVVERSAELVGSLNKVQSLYLQNISADLILISPFIGMDTDTYFGPEVWINPKYKKNSIDSALRLADDLMDVWSSLFDELSIERKTSFLKGLNFITSFLREGLYSSGLKKSMFFYETLNEVFYGINKYLYEYEYDQLNGMDYLKLAFYDREFTRQISKTTNSALDYLSGYSKEDRSKFIEDTQLLLNEKNGEVISNFFDNAINIIRVGVTELNLEDSESSQNKNFNFYENFVRYAAIKNENGETKINLFGQWLNQKKNRDSVVEVLKNFLGMISLSH